MPSILIYSIPHTGTHFLHKLLTDNGIEAGTAHITDQIEDLTPYRHVIIPLRAPHKVAESWAKRFKVNGSVHEWRPSWSNLLRIWHECHIFNLDGDRYKELSRLSELLNTTLKTDWHPENSMELKADPCIAESDIRYAIDVYNTVTELK